MEVVFWIFRTWSHIQHLSRSVWVTMVSVRSIIGLLGSSKGISRARGPKRGFQIKFLDQIQDLRVAMNRVTFRQPKKLISKLWWQSDNFFFPPPMDSYGHRDYLTMVENEVSSPRIGTWSNTWGLVWIRIRVYVMKNDFLSFGGNPVTYTHKFSRSSNKKHCFWTKETFS